MPAPSTTLMTIMAVMMALSASTSASANTISFSQPMESSQLPAGVSDLLAATPTMLSSVSAPLRRSQDKTKSKTLRSGNTVTVTGSDIVFPGSDKPTLIETILSMIRNSEPGSVGDAQLTRSIMTVLSAEGSDHENVVKKQLEAALACRDHEEMLRKCVETLVEIATIDAAPKQETADDNA